MARIRHDKYEVENEKTAGFISTITNIISKPFRVAASKPAQRAYLTTILVVSTSFILFGLATTAYLLFYWSYIPRIGFERNIHLQFDNVYSSNAFKPLREAHPYPYGTAKLSPDVVSGQQYDIKLEIAMPRSPANKDAGNFMLELELFGPSDKGSNAAGSVVEIAKDRIEHLMKVDSRSSLAYSRRSAILPYRSYLVELAYKISELHWYVLGFRSEVDKLVVPMFERVEFERGWRNVPALLKLEIQSTREMQIYSAKAVFRARFTGLRWLMYNHRITSAVVFITTFWLTELVFAGLAWAVMTFAFAGPDERMMIKAEQIHEVAENVKEERVEGEEEGVGAMSETERTFPSLRGRPPVRYSSPAIKQEEMDEPALPAETPGKAAEADDEDEDEDGDFFIDSGIGTSLESGASRRDSVRRRRSKKGLRSD